MGKLRVYWLKTLKKPSIYPLGKTPSAPSASQLAVPHVHCTLPLSHHNWPRTTLSPRTQLTLHTILLTLTICSCTLVKGSCSPPLLFMEASHTHHECLHCYVLTSFPTIHNALLWPLTFTIFPSTRPSPSYSGPWFSPSLKPASLPPISFLT